MSTVSRHANTGDVATLGKLDPPVVRTLMRSAVLRGCPVVPLVSVHEALMTLVDRQPPGTEVVLEHGTGTFVNGTHFDSKGGILSERGLMLLRDCGLLKLKHASSTRKVFTRGTSAWVGSKTRVIAAPGRVDGEHNGKAGWYLWPHEAARVRQVIGDMRNPKTRDTGLAAVKILESFDAAKATPRVPDVPTPVATTVVTTEITDVQVIRVSRSTEKLSFRSRHGDLIEVVFHD